MKRVHLLLSLILMLRLTCVRAATGAAASFIRELPRYGHADALADTSA